MSIERLHMQSPDLVNENIEKLAALFPNCITETAQGKAIDFDLLKQELHHAVIVGNEERYRLDWPGKQQAIVDANLPANTTLHPVREDSIDFDHTENLYIEGDNLEVLKLLQESYADKIKMIYIDPPYNTGNDFVYNDNFIHHAAWLSMMYPRLKLARNLLKDDGVIFISIDDNEVHNLKIICDEIFGEINFESQIAWRRRHNQPNDKSKMIAKVTEYILVYAKNSQILKEKKTYYGLPLSEDRMSAYTNPDNDPNGPWTSNPWKAAVGRGGSRYKLTTINGTLHDEVWYGNQETFNEHVKNGRVYWTDGGSGYPRIKIYVEDAKKSGQAAINFFTHEKFGSNQEGSAELQEILGVEGLFENPKPLRLLKALIKLATLKDEDIILDFFSGSAGIGQAVYELNHEEKTNRKFILVQLPVETGKDSHQYKAGYANICEIGKERLRRSGKKFSANQSFDYGFRVYRTEMKEI